MKNKLVKTLFCVIIAFCATFMLASCGDDDAIGSDEYIQYELNDDNSTATVIGHSAEFEALESYTLSSTFENEGKTYSVIAIAPRAFFDCNKLKSIEIPSSVKEIGSFAFYQCTSLESITVPASVTKINDGTFYLCSSLNSVQFAANDKITEIGEVAFSYCESLKGIKIPVSVEKIGNNAFYNCKSIESVTIDDLAKWCKIDFNSDSMFFYSNPLGYGAELIVGESKLITFAPDETITSVCNGAFFGCTTIEKIDIPATCTKLGSSAFENCSSLKEVKIAEGIKELSDYLFYQCTELEKLDISSAATLVDESVFYNCDKILDVNVPTSIIPNITKNLLKTVVINGGSTINPNAFANCANIETVSIPSTVTLIGTDAFYNCKKLYTISVDSSNIVYQSIDGNLYSKDGTQFIAYAIGKTASVFNMGDAVTEIAQDAMAYAVNVKDLYISKNAQKIGKNAFSNVIPEILNMPANAISSVTRSGLKKVTISTGTEITPRAFSGIETLTEVHIAPTITRVGAAIFDGTPVKIVECPDTILDILPKERLEEVTVNAGTTIPAKAFYNSVRLKKVVIPSTITEIKDQAFYGCLSLTDISVDADNATYKSVEGSLYSKSGDTLLVYARGKDSTSFAIPFGTITVSKDAFQNALNLTTVSIPASVTSIGADAFLGCIKLNSFDVDTSNTVYSMYDGNLTNKAQNKLIKYAFGKATETTVVNGSFTEIESNAFSDIASIMIISDSFKEERKAAGKEITYTTIKNITIPSTVTSVGTAIFNGLSFETATVPCACVTSLDKSAIVTLTVNGGTKIPDEALKTSKTLTTLVLGPSVKEIGGKAFFECKSLASINGQSIASDATNEVKEAGITLPSTVEYVGIEAFTSTLVVGKTRSDGLSLMGEWLVKCDTSKNSIVVPDVVKRIADGAFAGCTKITSLTIHDNIEYIASAYSFNACNPIRITAPASAFAYFKATKLQEATITSGTELADNVFNGYSYLKAVSIPATLTTIGNSAFNGCASLSDITIADGNTLFKVIDKSLYSFDGTTLIRYASAQTATEFIVPSTVTTISDGAFYGSVYIEKVKIDSGVVSIGNLAFEKCDKLASIEIKDANANYVSIDGVLYTKDKSVLIKYPQAKTDAKLTIDSATTTIITNAIDNAKSLVTIEIPASVVTIENDAIYDCKALQAINVNASNAEYKSDSGVLYIGNFEKLLKYPEGKKDTSYTVKSNIINSYAFDEVSALKEIVLPSTATTIFDNAFYGCKFTSVTTPISLIDKFNASYVTELSLNAGTELTKMNLYSYTSLVKITIGSTVTSIEKDTFKDLKKIDTFVVDANNTIYSSDDGNLYSKDGKTLIKYALGNKRTEFTIKASVEYIEQNAFYGSTYLTGVTFETNKWLTSENPEYNNWSFLDTSIAATNIKNLKREGLAWKIKTK